MFGLEFQQESECERKKRESISNEKETKNISLNEDMLSAQNNLKNKDQILKDVTYEKDKEITMLREHEKPGFESFEELRAYTKSSKEKDQNTRNETSQMLTRLKESDVENRNEIPKENEKYSYLKVKLETKGKVKQLKEYFQRLEEEKKERRKNVYIKKNEPAARAVKKWLHDRIMKSHSKGNQPGIEYGPYVYMENGNDTTSNKDGWKEEMLYEHLQMNKEEFVNSKTKEIDLLFKIMTDLKQNYERDGTYLSKLKHEMKDSNKMHMIDKILDLLKWIKQKKDEESGVSTECESPNNEVKKEKLKKEIDQSSCKEIKVSESLNEDKLKELETKISNMELSTLDNSESKKEESEMKLTVEEEMKKKGNQNLISDNKERNTKTNIDSTTFDWFYDFMYDIYRDNIDRLDSYCEEMQENEHYYPSEEEDDENEGDAEIEEEEVSPVYLNKEEADKFFSEPT